VEGSGETVTDVEDDPEGDDADAADPDRGCRPVHATTSSSSAITGPSSATVGRRATGRCSRTTFSPVSAYDACVTDTGMTHVRAVQADYDARSPHWADVYEGTSYHDIVLQRRLAIAEQLLADRDRAARGLSLDVGCGAGQLLEVLRADGSPVAGVDVSWAQAASTKRRLGSTVVAQADSRHLPFADASVATVTALGLLEYLPSSRAGIAEFARVLTTGGHLVVSTPNPWRLEYLCDPIGAVLGRLGPTRPGYRRQYLSARRLRAQLREAGFDVVDIKGHGFGRFTLARRPLLSEGRSVRVSDLLDARLSASLRCLLGANLVAIARRR
jgi:2-polyprenyl-3-methyl-5-hydroxy-6-metoxy-1,4-benzoquinol methylase